MGVYEDIESGMYQESIPCRLVRINQKEASEILGRATDLLVVERVPRIVHGQMVKQERPEESRETVYLVVGPGEAVANTDIFYLARGSADKGIKAELVLSYKYFTHTELLKRAGIEEEEYQSSYNKVGGIIHLNIKEEALKHKKILSRVLFDKIKDCKTVIRKASSISGVFRNFEIEHLQGEKTYATVQKENGLRFAIDYDKVYWNSKLQMERHRLVEVIKRGDTVCDMFCGVGPFSILALLHGARVWANDLNPDSIKNFKESIVLNRKPLQIKSRSSHWNDQLEDRVHLSNQDAGVFLEEVTEAYNQGSREIELFDHYILNLPELTLQYVRHFPKIESRAKNTGRVHAYFFIHPGESAVAKIEEAMQRKVVSTQRLVRKVSPSKEMWLVSFLLGKTS
ncbi:tRNA (guanine37-N1)-methyltransferase [Nematocida displodere]|uniref:tRNA (guanine(37)-N1)-methyltransferase n=1 Tax=Nematocida displodere TaxID=1805483 RepID=A0A177EAP4_9MICR|nr:tRNA (guanine37-N1)-methyltransferase [Nematocida displodere]